MVAKAAAFLLAVSLAASASAQQWAEKMFPVRTHDFGTVARFAKTDYKFVFTNLYLEDVEVADAHASCGCTSVQVKNPLVKTYEKGSIVATFNTNAFLGHRGATITVTFLKPFPATVQLNVSGVIREDVAVNPNLVDLGNLDAGKGEERWIAVAGHPGWQVTGVQSPNPHIHGEVARLRPSTAVPTYDIRVRVDGGLPPGQVRERLLLTTNDPNLPQIPIAVEGRVASSVTISPASLFIGMIQSGQQVTRQLVLQAKKPFRIVSVTGDNKYFQVSASPEAGQDAKAVHVLPITIKVQSQPGKAEETIRIKTDLNEATPELNTVAIVRP